MKAHEAIHTKPIGTCFLDGCLTLPGMVLGLSVLIRTCMLLCLLCSALNPHGLIPAYSPHLPRAGQPLCCSYVPQPGTGAQLVLWETLSS